ncbi:MAG: Deaminated glutathione amidase [Pseudomonadales bacterium]|nr:Deaminated glutathione amidase [Pseudomonadales bacterium]
MTGMTRVAALQMVSTDDVAHNLGRARELIAAAAARGARLVVLPEAFAYFGGTANAEVGCAECSADGPLRAFLAASAREHGIVLVGGTVPVADARAPGRVRAACFVYDRSGREIARYDKIHLFDVDLPDAQRSYRESDTIEPGEDPVCVPGPCGTLGLGVCYDLRFPALFLALAERGMDVLALPSAFTRVTGEAHWHVLVRARAIENQVHVIAPNQGGRHSPTRETWGGTVIVDPWGRVLASAAGGEAVVVADIDPQERACAAARIPLARQRRFAVVSRLIPG